MTNLIDLIDVVDVNCFKLNIHINRLRQNLCRSALKIFPYIKESERGLVLGLMRSPEPILGYWSSLSL